MALRIVIDHPAAANALNDGKIDAAILGLTSPRMGEGPEEESPGLFYDFSNME